MGVLGLASASTCSIQWVANFVVLGLVLNFGVVCSGGKTSTFVRQIDRSLDMPLDSDVFKVPPGYNAPQQVYNLLFFKIYSLFHSFAFVINWIHYEV